MQDIYGDLAWGEPEKPDTNFARLGIELGCQQYLDALAITLRLPWPYLYLVNFDVLSVGLID